MLNVDIRPFTRHTATPKVDPRYKNGNRPAGGVFYHGDTISLTGTFGTNPVTKDIFLGGAGGLIESTALGTVPSSPGFIFTDTLGNPITIGQESTRGKVIYGTNANLTGTTPPDSVFWYDSGAPIPEHTKIYWARWERVNILLDGANYPHDFQTKHMRMADAKSITDDSANNVKWNSWRRGDAPPVSEYAGVYDGNGSASGGFNLDTNAFNFDNFNGWCLVEYFVDTGTQGGSDGRVVFRTHQNGITKVIRSKNNCKIYNTASRLRWFNDQMYLGNWAQQFDRVNSPLPQPQVRDIWRDDVRIIVGDGATTGSGWKRIEISDSANLATATVREIQRASSWSNSQIDFKLNTGGLPSGIRQVYVRVIDGLDGTGMDNVIDTQQRWIAVQ